MLSAFNGSKFVNVQKILNLTKVKKFYKRDLNIKTLTLKKKTGKKINLGDEWWNGLSNSYLLEFNECKLNLERGL